MPPQGWRVVGASIQGTSHARTGQPCQDAHCWRILPNGTLVAAVADGAGSASLGEVGAELAATSAVNALAEAGANLRLDGDDEEIRQQLNQAMVEARAAVEAEAGARDVAERELSTTLILLAASPDTVAVAQVGDGAVVAGPMVVGQEGDSVAGITAPQFGEYINETVFLTSPEALEVTQVNVWRGRVACGAMFSDGLQLLCLNMPGGKPHAPFFGPLFSFMTELSDAPCGIQQGEQQLRSFLMSPRITSSTTDDLTLVLFAPI